MLKGALVGYDCPGPLVMYLNVGLGFAFQYEFGLLELGLRLGYDDPRRCTHLGTYLWGSGSRLGSGLAYT